MGGLYVCETRKGRNGNRPIRRPSTLKISKGRSRCARASSTCFWTLILRRRSRPRSTPLKENKVLTRKIDLEQKLKDFEAKGNRWLATHPTTSFHQPKTRVLRHRKKTTTLRKIVAKVGSNRLLCDQKVSLSFKNNWQMLADFHTTPRSGADKNGIYIGLLGGKYNEFKTLVKLAIFGGIINSNVSSLHGFSITKSLPFFLISDCLFAKGNLGVEI